MRVGSGVILFQLAGFLTSALADFYFAKHNIHRNTLIYRLGKISKLLELDLKVLTEEQLFYLTFSCKLVAYI